MPVGRPRLPPSDDPVVQAKREKARAYAQEGRDKAKVRTAKAKAGATIAGAIKRKLATPKKKKVDDNRLHNLPEDLQKKIMGIARPPPVKGYGYMERIRLPMTEIVKYFKQYPKVVAFIKNQGYSPNDTILFRYKPYAKYDQFVFEYEGKDYPFKINNSVDLDYSTYLYDRYYKSQKKKLYPNTYRAEPFSSGSDFSGASNSNSSSISLRKGYSSPNSSSSGSSGKVAGSRRIS